MSSSSQLIQLFLSKFHPNCQVANILDWQKQGKFEIDTTFEVVKILSVNFQDFFKSLNSVCVCERQRQRQRQRQRERQF